jgi:hypothetical protein
MGSHLWDQEWFDVGYHGDGTKSLENTYFLLLAWRHDTLFGLMIEPVHLQTSTYRIVGAFGHDLLQSDRTTVSTRHRPPNEDCPELNGFDLENFERQVITII